MSTQSTNLEKASSWNSICFPVKEVKLQDLLPASYKLLPSDRQRAIVGFMPDGTQHIFALQSNEYTLIPNDLLRSVVNTVATNYEIDTRFSSGGDFCINIIMPDSLKVGNERIYKNLIINNSYTGKSPFNIQGSSIESTNEEKVKVSYYRQICSNGLMGWADEFMTHEEYFNWLANGQPRKYLDALKEKVEHVNIERIKREDKILAETFPHKSLNLEFFKEHLTNILRNFVVQKDSITGAVYNKMVQVSMPTDADVQKVIVEAGLPKKLACLAVERLRNEEIMLETEANLWLLYNAANYALFNGKSALTINERFKADQKAFNNIAARAI
ncbi:hypothetical protein [Adhaeribacter rhizoryzae]|uniref:DUF932 domain-containing protein n=1 Tax=Adhaeribacter rhizoryzae TaxID=2607907 RepID=A0A5M6D6V9_9BACT|nr:hypothetical protein [Adhaeribacter rhizoryzae]KAA5541982.1 hypothetical protein F0145_19540 [Adhaeribacter rhizoryzae]